MENVPVGLLVSSIGFLLGVAFGATAQRTNFCTMGAVSDIVFLEDWNRFRSWVLAMAVAILGSQLLYQTGQIDLAKSIYLTPNFGWAGAIVGGLLFGFGMTMGGGCGNKTLVRMGAGNLKSVVVAIFIGLFAYMTLRGLIGLGRVQFEGLTIIDLTAKGLQTQGIPDFLAAMTSLPLEKVQLVVAALIVAGMFWYCFKSSSFRASKSNIAGGLIIGALIPAAWYLTGVIGADEFDPVPLASFTFVSPVGESLQYLMTFSGASINFGIAAIGGVITGAFLMAKLTGTFQLESFTGAEDMVRNMSGGAIMGIGGVLALGCTIGQGVTGLSTLALGSFIALGSILAGGFFGMKYLEYGKFSDAFRALFTPSGN